MASFGAFSYAVNIMQERRRQSEMTDTHDTTPQADTPPVMVAIGADLIREAIEVIRAGNMHAQAHLAECGWNGVPTKSIEADIARMGATAKALAEALPGCGA